MNAFQSWLAGAVKKAGGHSAFLRLAEITSGRLHGWQAYGALPLEPDLVTSLAKATGEDEQRLRDLIWDSLRQKKLAPEVGPSRQFRSIKTAGRGVSTTSPAPNRRQRPIRSSRRKAVCIALVAALGAVIPWLNVDAAPRPDVFCRPDRRWWTLAAA